MSFSPIPLEINAKVIDNLGAENGILKLRFSLIPKHIREALDNRMNLGIINFRLEVPIIAKIKKNREEFFFKECSIKYEGKYNGKEQKAYICKSSSTPNNGDLRIVELITELVPDFEVGMKVRLILPDSKIVNAAEIEW